MYNEKAKALRRCKATRKDAQPCQAWALWSGEFCSAHTYLTRRTGPHPDRYTGMRTKALPCTCQAYAWPHRPGAGLCNWPDPPRRVSTIPAGTHSWFRTYKRQYRILVRRWGLGL